MNDRFKLNPTRIFLLAMLAVSLALAISTIVASIDAWQQQDAEIATPPGAYATSAAGTASAMNPPPSTSDVSLSSA